MNQSASYTLNRRQLFGRASCAAGLAVLLLGNVGCTVICALLGIPVEDCNLGFDQPIGGLSVEIEVRFIAVEDDFFENIGVDFDFEIESEPVGTTVQPPTSQPANTTLAPSSQTGGPVDTNMLIPKLLASSPFFLPTFSENQSPPMVNFFPGVPSPDFQVPTDGTTALPNLNDLTGGINLGTWSDPGLAGFELAILSDLEAEIFMQAALADEGVTTFTAHRVKLFNGQQALVISNSESTLVTDLQEPYQSAVTSFDPQIQTIQSGPMLNASAVISADRRFVSLTIVPIRAITIVPSQTFNINGVNNSILLPVFQVARVQTTVSVPDGGTVLLGGYRPDPDGEVERGLPILNMLPYIQRLFKNAGLVRDNQLLLLMVTPRIIIQEE